MAADNSTDDPGGATTESSQHKPADAVSEPKSAVTREKNDAPAVDPSEPDEFGLPAKQPRRRGYSLQELENPEQARPSELKAAVEEGQEGGQHDADKPSTSEERGAKGKEVDMPSAEGATQRRGQDDDGKDTEKKEDELPPADVTPQKPSAGATSEWSHMQLAPHSEPADNKTNEEDLQWQDMPALAEHRIYDDWGKVLAKSYDEAAEDDYGYSGLGGAGKGYTRVQVDDDAQSATSMDEHTAYLFKDGGMAQNTLLDEEGDEEARDVVGQMDTTKNLLTEAQKFAYVGVVRLAINEMVAFAESLERTKGTKKLVDIMAEGTKMWGQKMMVRLYLHMDVSEQEQVMLEQLAEHGVRADDLTPALMANARVKNPQGGYSTNGSKENLDSGRQSSAGVRSSTASFRESKTNTPATNSGAGTPSLSSDPGTPQLPEEDPAEPPPAYEEQTAEGLTPQSPSELKEKDIDLDIRWTVLCDLFLLLVADSVYDARSRTLLEKIGAALSVPWQEICRFEKRVTDALEMQQEAEKENWNEEDHLKAREKKSRNKRLMVMGLCTVGGGLVIGLSAGMLAPVIGGGLAAGFTGLGIAGTSGFLGGTGAAALIGTTGTLIGGGIGMKGASRRTGAVKTFEYRPLYNNKRVNLIVTVAGWMTGKVDDVRLPFSTVDPIMGDIYSLNWEPEMLQSTGQTVQILGTEALAQTIQSVLGATFFSALVAGLSLPLILTKLSYLVDNPWAVSLARADATGLVLADSLIDRNLGIRPITLVGFSLGSRVIFSCLKELARRGAMGLVQNVYMFGSPVVVKRDEWIRARAVVSGRFVNGYAVNDWILAYLFRATSGGIMRVAGLKLVEVPGIENHDITENVPGHMAYRGMMPTLLHEVGWSVESVEFTEIEDPDPENHEQRQRELIKEIEEARREAEAKPEKKGLKAFFSRKKGAKKREWETYDERNQQSVKALHGENAEESEKMAAENSTVMFDVDAIRREALQLAVAGGDINEIKQHLQVKEIESTLPALKIESPKHSGPPSGASTPALQRAQTHDGSGNNSTFAKADGANGHHATTPSKKTNEYDYGGDDNYDDDSEITMSFETPDRQANGSGGGSSHDAWEEPRNKASWDTLPTRSTPNERPPLKSVQTSPALGSTQQQDTKTVAGEKNPWAEDEEFGKEKEMELSFE
ncbi:hypothetical protein D0862_02639 [Hortaea werneckii]|uniref:DUF726 domain protein n=1 Tax=Hortaea werneckii TaxID=91943 RepID=A0A3M7HHF0_HORWE|nr:hypothetical protein D0862_02639 [Hortaea werneckii]